MMEGKEVVGMDYVELTVMQFHRIAHSHSMTQNDYSFRLSSYGFGCYGPGPLLGGVFEIGFVEKNPLVFHFLNNNRTITVREEDVYIIPPNERVEIHALYPGEHKHTSAEFLLDCATRPLEKPDPDNLGRWNVQALPYLFPASRENDELIALIRQISRDRMLMAEKSYFEECEAFMQIMVLLSRMMQKRGGVPEVPPSQRRYCQKAKEYISQHIDRHITMEEIAAYVGISKNYLTNIFTICEHVPISEYMGRVKLNCALELIVKYDYSIKRAGEAVGFYDENYVSRLFKKYHGITISEYRRMQQDFALPPPAAAQSKPAPRRLSRSSSLSKGVYQRAVEKYRVPGAQEDMNQHIQEE